MMKPRRHFHRVLSGSLAVAAALVVFPGPGRLQAEDEGNRYLPVSPETLLAFLPKNVTGWKLTRSTAQTRMTGWLSTIATRSFEKVLTAEEATLGPPPTITISIIDPGEPTPTTAMFENFQPGETESAMKILIDSYPAIVSRPKTTKPYVTLFAAKRFTLFFELEGQELKELKPWLESCNFTGLKKIPEPRKIAELPSTLESIKIDELDPRKSQRYKY